MVADGAVGHHAAIGVGHEDNILSGGRFARDGGAASIKVVLESGVGIATGGRKAK